MKKMKINIEFPESLSQFDTPVQVTLPPVPAPLRYTIPLHILELLTPFDLVLHARTTIPDVNGDPGLGSSSYTTRENKALRPITQVEAMLLCPMRDTSITRTSLMTRLRKRQLFAGAVAHRSSDTDVEPTRFPLYSLNDRAQRSLWAHAYRAWEYYCPSTLEQINQMAMLTPRAISPAVLQKAADGSLASYLKSEMEFPASAVDYLLGQ